MRVLNFVVTCDYIEFWTLCFAHHVKEIFKSLVFNSWLENLFNICDEQNTTLTFPPHSIYTFQLIQTLHWGHTMMQFATPTSSMQSPTKIAAKQIWNLFLFLDKSRSIYCVYVYLLHSTIKRKVSMFVVYPFLIHLESDTTLHKRR